MFASEKCLQLSRTCEQGLTVDMGGNYKERRINKKLKVEPEK